MAAGTSDTAGPPAEDSSSDGEAASGAQAIGVDATQFTYPMWCPVGHHRALGAQTTLTVG